MEENKTLTSLEDAMFNDDFKSNIVVEEAPVVEPVENKFVTEPVEETPIEEPIVEEKPLEEPATVIEPTEEIIENVEIKEVVEAPAPIIQEKIVEKAIEFKDEHAEKLYKAVTEGGEEGEKALLQYLNNKYAPYDKMPTMDVLREKIKNEKPHWDADDINAEMEARYGEEKLTKIDISLIDEDETDKIERAEQFNKEVDRLLKLRERDGKDARVFLESKKQNIELPSIGKKEEEPAPQQTQAEIEAEERKWSENVDTQMSGFSEIKMNVGNEEITYKFTDAERQERVEYMKKINPSDLFKDLGWLKADGTDDILRIAEDVQKLKDFKKIVSSIGTQMKTSAKKEIIAKDIKNIDLNDNIQHVQAPKQDAGDYILSL